MKRTDKLRQSKQMRKDLDILTSIALNKGEIPENFNSNVVDEEEQYAFKHILGLKNAIMTDNVEVVKQILT